MAVYKVTHLHSSETFTRPAILTNPHLKQTAAWKQDTNVAAEAFHLQLPDYGETALHSLPSVAKELGFAHVFLKNESTRFGLPSFKILGASWAIHKALCKYLELDSISTTMAVLKEALTKARDSGTTVRLVSCTEGNWGRALSRMAKYLEVPVTIYVPGFMNEYTRNPIRGEGATVEVLKNGSYDDTIAAARNDSQKTGSLLVMDTSWEGFTEIPGWVTEGYSTMLREVDRQVSALTGGEKHATLAIASVGVGSWAHAVVSHYCAASKENKIVTVEPTAAPSLKESLHFGDITPIRTGETIMNGMNCGTTSTIAWPIMRDGVDAAVVVNDVESHRCVKELQGQGLNVGPCGAATLAALKKLCDEDVFVKETRSDMVVVLFSTEGGRDYELPE